MPVLRPPVTLLTPFAPLSCSCRDGLNGGLFNAIHFSSLPLLERHRWDSAHLFLCLLFLALPTAAGAEALFFLRSLLHSFSAPFLALALFSLRIVKINPTHILN